MRGRVKELAGYSFFVITSGWVAFNFVFICLNGESTFREPLIWLRIVELSLALGIFGLAIERWINFVRRK